MGCKISLIVEEPSALELISLFNLATLWTCKTITFFIKYTLKDYIWCERQASRNETGEEMDKCKNLRTATQSQTGDLFSLVLCHPVVAHHGCCVEQIRTGQVCNIDLPRLFFHIQQFVAWK